VIGNTIKSGKPGKKSGRKFIRKYRGQNTRKERAEATAVLVNLQFIFYPFNQSLILKVRSRTPTPTQSVVIIHPL
jgi:hypothetical protein